MNNWEKTAEYYESLASLQGRDPYSQRALLWYAETCRARSEYCGSPTKLDQRFETEKRPRKIAR